MVRSSKTFVAALNVGASLADQLLRNVASLLLMPRLVVALGKESFGAWQELLKVGEQFSTLDGRASEYVKWSIAKDLDNDDVGYKRRLVGKGLQISAIFFPLFTVCFFSWVLFFPVSGIQDAGLVVFLVFANVAVNTVCLFLESILRGSNLGYRRTGIQGGGFCVGAIIALVALNFGYGLVGVAFGYFLGTIARFIALQIVLIRSLSWLGFEFVSWLEVLREIRTSISLVFASFSEIGLVSIDVIILSEMSGQSIVSDYTFTRFPQQLIPVVVFQVFSALLPGIIGKLAGKLDNLTESFYREFQALVVVLAVGLCGGLLLIEKSFVTHWVGPENHIGLSESHCFLIATYFFSVSKVDGYLLQAFFRLKGKILVTVVSLGSFGALVTVLFPLFSVLGFAFSFLVSRVILLVGFHEILARSRRLPRQFLRAFGGASILLVFSIGSRTLPIFGSMLTDVLVGFLGFLGAGILTWFVVVSRETRIALSTRTQILFR